MKLRLLLPVLPVVLVVTACSVGSSSIPDELQDTSLAQSGAAADDDETEGEDGAFGTPSDDPTTGALEDDSAQGFGAAAAPKGNNCVVGGSYCGGDKVTGDAKALYKCNGPGAPTVLQKCTTTCKVNTGVDDSCAVDPSAHVASPVPGVGVTYAYGVKNSRYAAGFHTGEDHATPTGSSAVAVRSGTIRWSNDAGGAYGRWIGLDADNGRTYVYCHLSSRLVAAGTKVTAGQVIAKTGATGNVTGPHLHFEDHPRGNFVYAQVRKPSW